MKLLERLKFSSSSNISKTEVHQQQSDFYAIKIKSPNGDNIQLSDFKDKYLLFVNVASKCGFTPQYRALQQLQDDYKDKLTVIGLPCNQFARQEPDSAEKVRSFCERNFGVTFPLTDKVHVKGSRQHPLYQWLTRKEFNGKSNSSVKWNFQKYLVNDKGELVDYFYSVTKPNSSKIIKHLK